MNMTETKTVNDLFPRLWLKPEDLQGQGDRQQPTWAGVGRGALRGWSDGSAYGRVVRTTWRVRPSQFPHLLAVSRCSVSASLLRKLQRGPLWDQVPSKAEDL